MADRTMQKRAYHAAHRDHHIEQSRAWRRENPERRAAAQRKQNLRKFGLTVEAYDRMLAAQGGVCAICRGGTPGRRLDVDHDHGSGAVRALLCRHCNVGLGYFRDSVNLLGAAADYLGRHGKR